MEAQVRREGRADACLRLAHNMYVDRPSAREVGHVEEAAGVATSAGVMEGHDVPPDVLTGVVHCGRGGMIHSTSLAGFVGECWRGVGIASMTGAWWWAN